MITDQDVEKLKETFVTKKEHASLVEKVDRIDTELKDLTVEVRVIGKRMDVLEDKFDVMDGKLDLVLTSLDVLTGNYQDSLDEHRAGAQVLARHERQIGALARATGTSLPD